MPGNRLLVLFTLLAAAAPSFAQARPEIVRYGDRNTFSFFGEYSNDSSHILLGVAENRKLSTFGAGYSRRLFSTRLVDFRYMAEIRPVLLESDPLTNETVVRTSPLPATTSTQSFTQIGACQAGSSNNSFVYQGVTYAFTVTNTCSRQWTFGEGFSPAGIRLNFLTRQRLQPVFTASGGYLLTTKAIPVAQAGSANYTFEFGIGLELFRGAGKSIGAEYRYNHISNNYTAYENPGIDSGLLQISYSFGR